MHAPRDTISAGDQDRDRAGAPGAGRISHRRISDAAANSGRTLQPSQRLATSLRSACPSPIPMADGSTIQRASFVALADGVTLPWILEEISRLPRAAHHAHPADELFESLARLRARQLAASRGQAGVAGFIVPDLPYEESGDLKTALEREGLALVQMVTPVTPAPRLAMLCRAAQGFVYAVTMTGTTGKSASTSARARCSITWIGSSAALRFPCVRDSASARARRSRALRRTWTASWSAPRWWRRWSAARTCGPSWARCAEGGGTRP